MTDAAPAASAAPPVRRRPGRATVVVGAVLLALAAGAVIAVPLGGWDTVELESAHVPTMAAGEEYPGTHYAVRVEEAWVGDVLPEEYDTPEDGHTFVIVRAVLRNQWREADTQARSALTFDALDALESFERSALVRVAADGTYLTTMPPGVDVEVLMRWEVPSGSVAPGDPLTLGVIDGRPDRAVLYSGTAWRDERVVVETTVVPRPSEELEYAWQS
ncbi:MAG: hypothetical protein ACTHMQ_09050 [Protaetiibacter sp.]